MTPARIAVATALTQIRSSEPFIQPAAEPEPEHAPDLVGNDACHQQDQQRVPVADEIAHARALTR